MISLPMEFVTRMKELLGDEAEPFLESYEKERAFGLRLNLAKCSLEEFEKMAPFSLRRIPWTSCGYFYGNGERPGRHPWHEAGLYYIQEPSAMSPAELLDVQPGQVVLDLCAAPGGKSTQIAGKLQGKGVLVSNEIHPERARILSQNIERMGIGNAIVMNETPASLTERFPEFFDRIMVDAPCSGEGMFRKDEEARTQWSEEHVHLCARRQDEILACAAKMLKPGGKMVYSTCTFAPEEDEGSAARFLHTHPDFSVDCDVHAYKGFSEGKPEWIAERDADIAEQIRHTFRVWPHKMEGEGHYFAVFRKTGSREQTAGKKLEKISLRKKNTRSNDGKKWEPYIAFVQEYMTEASRWMQEERLLLFGEQLYYLPEGLGDCFSGIKVLRPGLHLGTFKKNRFEPSHAWALHLNAEDVKQSKNLSADSAEIGAYLRGETLTDEEGRKGWTLILTDQISVGWAKAASGILKNHYPKGLRWYAVSSQKS
ncbi:MAG: RsmB/NOP family class I SAM-dependent RNA methyltransferase [bacterium]|nr:RsmB/NOP family class I SAM-dependent RNA methyltransferase [bacterium]